MTTPKVFFDDPMALYFRDIEHSLGLEPEEECELSQRIKQGDTEARNKLVEANLRFVVSVAKKYQGLGLTLDELISTGNTGLITAAERFDAGKGFKFISYAVHWIRQAILQTLSEQTRVVRLPVNRIADLMELNNLAGEFEQERGRAPTQEDLLDELELEGKTRRDWIDMLAAAQPPLPLDAPLDSCDSDSRTVGDNLSLDDPPDRLDPLDREDFMKAIRSILDEREFMILNRYYGLDGE